MKYKKIFDCDPYFPSVSVMRDLEPNPSGHGHDNGDGKGDEIPDNFAEKPNFLRGLVTVKEGL